MGFNGLLLAFVGFLGLFGAFWGFLRLFWALVGFNGLKWALVVGGQGYFVRRKDILGHKKKRIAICGLK